MQGEMAIAVFMQILVAMESSSHRFYVVWQWGRGGDQYLILVFPRRLIPFSLFVNSALILQIFWQSAERLDQKETVIA